MKKVRGPEEVALGCGGILMRINAKDVNRRIDIIWALNWEAIGISIPVLIERNGQRKAVEALAKEKASTNYK